MKKLLIFLFLSPLFTIAQDKTLTVEGVSPKLYINHKVEAKENYYSIGRIYNISPKEIAPFNNLALESGLSLGQELKIPLTASNFFQSGNADADETFVPVYYTVKEKEGLYRVALNHDNLPLETLKQWNKIKGDAVKNGTKLIVGYLKVKKDLSSLAKEGMGTSIDAKAVTVVEEKKPPVTEPKKVPEEKPAKKITTTEVVPAVTSEDTNPVVKNPDNEKKEPAKTVKEPVKTEPKKIPDADKASIGGVFKNLYHSQLNDGESVATEGLAGVFKSTSGWADKKYYCLHNQATPGTIVKIINPANGKFVYAKVLDMMPDIKQNEGLLIILSNAAAEELGATDSNFNCLINYSK